MFSTINPQATRADRRRPGRWHWGLLGLFIVLFFAYYGTLALCQRDSFVSSLDLADVDQTLWNTVHGRFLHMTARPPMSSRLGFHVEPILLALLPLYAVAPSAETLVLIQVIALALVAVPLYLLGAEALRQPTWALTIPLLYLLSPATHNAALGYFHPVTLGVLPAIAALVAVWRGKVRTALLFAAVALLAREDYGLWLAALSIVGWAQSRKRMWIVIGLVGVAWFLVATLVIIPEFLTEHRSLFWNRYRFLLDGPEAWRSQGFLIEKGSYLLKLLLLGGAGALLAPMWVLPALPALGLNLLANYTLPVSFDSYYSSLIAPVLLAAATIGLSRCRPNLQKAGILLLLATSLWVHCKEGRSPLVPGFRPPDCTTRHDALHSILAMIPDDAHLSASETVMSHVSRREWLEVFPRCRQCDYFLVDLLQDRRLPPLEVQQRVLNLLDGEWGVVAGTDGFLLLKQSGSQTLIPTNLGTFARPTSAPQYPMQVVFDTDWELQGYDVSWDRWGRPAVRLYWQIRQAAKVDLQPAALALDGEDRLLASPDSHPSVALLWLPTSQWQPGRTYVVEMLPFDAPDRLELFAGVGGPVVDPSTRLHTKDGRDLVSLATLERHGRGWKVYPIPQDQLASTPGLSSARPFAPTGAETLPGRCSCAKDQRASPAPDLDAGCLCGFGASIPFGQHSGTCAPAVVAPSLAAGTGKTTFWGNPALSCDNASLPDPSDSGGLAHAGNPVKDTLLIEPVDQGP